MLLLGLLACNPAPTPTAPPLPTNLPAAATPVTLSIVAPAEAAVELDTTWGALGFLSLVDLSGQWNNVGVNQIGSHCPCRCNAEARCPECEPPMGSSVRLGAGERREFQWDGHLTHWRTDRDGDWCFEALPPTPGAWRLAACDSTGAHCAMADVPLPATQPVLLQLSGPPPEATTCPTGMETRLSRSHHQRMISQGTVFDRIKTCDPEVARCVLPDALEQALQSARDEDCTLWLIPRGEVVEVLASAPLPEGYVGGERFSSFWDPWGTRIIRVHNEQ